MNIVTIQSEVASILLILAVLFGVYQFMLLLGHVIRGSEATLLFGYVSAGLVIAWVLVK